MWVRFAGPNLQSDREEKKMHLPVVVIIWLVVRLVGKLEPVRLFLGRQALKKARPEDVPDVMRWSAKWQSPSWAKRR